MEWDVCVAQLVAWHVLDVPFYVRDVWSAGWCGGSSSSLWSFVVVACVLWSDVALAHSCMSLLEILSRSVAQQARCTR